MTPTKVVPYTTRSGVQIGLFYQPPHRHAMTKDEEFWQAIFLGIKPPRTIPTLVYSAVAILLAIKLLSKP